MCVSEYLLCLGPSHQALSKGTTPSRGDKENRTGLSGCQFQQYYGSTASDRMLRGRSPQGLGGAVYLLVRSFVRSRLFIRRCEVVDAFYWGSGGYYRILCIHVGSYRCPRQNSVVVVVCREPTVVFFKISPSENFSPPPSTPTTTTRSCPHAVRRLCVGSGSELRRLGSQPSPRTGAESDFDGLVVEYNYQLYLSLY